MKKPGIVLLEEAHLDWVMEIERASFGMPWSKESFERLIRNPSALAYAAMLDGVLAGYVCALSAGAEAEILKLAVDPSLRGRGVAKALNAKCLDELKRMGVGTVYLEVRRSNLVAISLYEGFGFRAAGIRKGYYSAPPEDALLMKLVF